VKFGVAGVASDEGFIKSKRFPVALLPVQQRGQAVEGIFA